jgi:hypothetical protein
VRVLKGALRPVNAARSPCPRCRRHRSCQGWTSLPTAFSAGATHNRWWYTHVSPPPPSLRSSPCTRHHRIDSAQWRPSSRPTCTWKMCQSDTGISRRFDLYTCRRSSCRYSTECRWCRSWCIPHCGRNPVDTQPRRCRWSSCRYSSHRWPCRCRHSVGMEESNN